jgi:hypothetical protein
VTPSTPTPSPESGSASSRRMTTSRRSYTLASLLLIMTLISVFLGVTVHSPAAGAVLFILCVPALIRTVAIRNRWKAEGLSMSFSMKTFSFVESLLIVAIIAAVTGGIIYGGAMLLISLLSTVRPVSNSFPVIVGVGVVVTTVVGGLVGLALVHKLWRLRD